MENRGGNFFLFIFNDASEGQNKKAEKKKPATRKKTARKRGKDRIGEKFQGRRRELLYEAKEERRGKGRGLRKCKGKWKGRITGKMKRWSEGKVLGGKKGKVTREILRAETKI